MRVSATSSWAVYDSALPLPHVAAEILTGVRLCAVLWFAPDRNGRSSGHGMRIVVCRNEHYVLLVALQILKTNLANVNSLDRTYTTDSEDEE